MATQVSLNSGAVASASTLALQTNGTTEAIGISTGQVATLAQNPILTSGTANGVAYLNGSKVVTTGSALVFDGTNLGIGASSPTSIANYKTITMNATTGSIIDLQSNGTTLGRIQTDTTYALALWTATATPMVFGTNYTERMRIDSSGNLLVGSSTDPFSSDARFGIFKSGSLGDAVQVTGSYTSFYAIPFQTFVVDANNFNAANSAVKMGKNNTTGRSLNAGGTVNASGADYAEYMNKAGNFAIAKGDVVGINAQGKLTNVFANAVSFVVKSTDPSYVGGDTWGGEDKIGKRPETDAPQEEQDAFKAALEAERQKVDRIAFAGQVPVNVTGATAGQYIVPVESNGAIVGQAVSNPTFEQYQQAVGKVIAIEQDGRARIIVKVA